MLKKSNLLVAAALFALSISTFGQKNLEKSYHTWTKEEALKILNGQPFSDKYQSEAGVAGVARQVAAADQEEQRIGSGPQFRTSRTLGPAPIVVRLQSSLPLRQAIVRLGQDIWIGEARPEVLRHEHVAHRDIMAASAPQATHAPGVDNLAITDRQQHEANLGNTSRRETGFPVYMDHTKQHHPRC